jgi:hypothetical protein
MTFGHRGHDAAAVKVPDLSRPFGVVAEREDAILIADDRPRRAIDRTPYRSLRAGETGSGSRA